ncbi:MAG: class I tRNA ligase family protein, partial [Myxococcales bacterium]|nr:class I tRNA ligase family protein [Myxococcales bacterium]
RTFEGYGKLSKRKLDDMIAGARVEANEAKRDPADFALWKGCVGEAWGWESPWGKGRPGWHIECSAMSARHLGHGFDVHCGGMDLIFPHHENEIAQSEGAYPEGGAFARTWIHNGFVNVDKEKMAKSLGNFVTIKQVYERNDPEALRYFLLSVHYRGPIQFDTEGTKEQGNVTFPGVIEAEKRVDYLYQTLDRLRALALSDKPGTLGVMPPSVSSYLTVANEALPKLRAALDDDLNTPVALSVIAEVAKSGNEFADVAQRKKDPVITKLAPYVASRLAKALVDVTERLGLLQTMPADYVARTRAQRLAIKGITAQQIDQLVADRSAARAAKDFTKADQVRAELTRLGIEIFDTPVGTSWRILP